MPDMKFLIATGLAITLFNQNANSQTLQDAISKTENERYEAAASDFRSLI